MADRLTQEDIKVAEEGVQTAKKHKKYIRDKYKKAEGYFKEMLNLEPSSNQDRLTEADIKGSFEKATPSQLIGTSAYEKALANEIAGVRKRNEIAGGMKRGGSVMSRGCKMGRNKPTKLY